MRSKRKQRITMVLLILFGSTSAVVLALYALSQNINLYYTPSQIVEQKAPLGTLLRVGGIVLPGSIHFAQKGLAVNFILTDRKHNIPIHFTGVLPDLFRANQGIVAQGELNKNDIFIADQVLAKHSATYMPPPVQAELQQAGISK